MKSPYQSLQNNPNDIHSTIILCANFTNTITAILITKTIIQIIIMIQITVLQLYFLAGLNIMNLVGIHFYH